MQWLLYVFVVVSGMLNTLQTGTNTPLSEKTGNPVTAAIFIQVVSIVLMGIVAPFVGVTFSSFTKITEAPWWSWIGGLLGATYVLALLYASPKIGSGAFTGLTVTAAVVTSVALDHFGALGLKEHPAGLWRIAGCILMLAGVVLVAKF